MAYSYEKINSDETKKSDSSNKCFRDTKIKLLVSFLVAVSLLTIILVSVLHHKSKKSNLQSLYSDIVNVDCGNIIGLKEFHKDKVSYVFKGIPYAQPPVKNLRWKPPQGLNKSAVSCWKDTLKATTFKQQCVQGSDKGILGDEDCLYLNVWTPTLDHNKNLPVFVWIHGGYLLTGNGSTKGYSPDSEFVTSMNVVAVSMNYRLNAFGFLTLKELWDEGKSYGNYGIMDQILVLKWIQKNIRNFGGDPNSVTLAGQSSGGTSIYGLLASPIAENLFHKAIPMSGSPKFTIDYKQASKDNRAFINKTRCHNQIKLKECLYNLTSLEVFYAIPFFKYPNWAMLDLLDFPTKGLFDGALIVTDPVIIKTSPQNVNQQNFKTNKSILTGSTAQEVAFAPPKHFLNYSSMETYLSSRLNAFSPKFPPIVLNDLYNTSEFQNKEAQYLFTTIGTDVRVSCPTNLLRSRFAESNTFKSYQYIVENSPEHPISIAMAPGKLMYAFHAWDSFALFDFAISKQYQPSANVKKFRDIYKSVVKEFMVKGNLNRFNWKNNQTGVFTMTGDINVLSSDYHAYQCRFWNNKDNGFTPYAWIN